MKTIFWTMRIVAAGLLLAAANPSALRAQGVATSSPAEKPEGPSIAGVGTARVKLAPTVLRMHLILLGRGKTAEDALAALKTRRELAVSQLEKLKVAKDSIAFSNLAASSGGNQQQRRMEMMIARSGRFDAGENVFARRQAPARVVRPARRRLRHADCRRSAATGNRVSHAQRGRPGPLSARLHEKKLDHRCLLERLHEVLRRRA